MAKNNNHEINSKSGPEGMKEPPIWKDYAQRLERIVVDLKDDIQSLYADL